MSNVPVLNANSGFIRSNKTSEIQTMNTNGYQRIAMQLELSKNLVLHIVEDCVTTKLIIPYS